MNNALIIHGGAPTAVINASLYGAVMEAMHYDRIDNIYAALGGSGGFMREELLDMRKVPSGQLALLPFSPASAIGSSRDMLREPEYEAIAKLIDKHHIRYVFFNGGNGSMDACGKVYKACQKFGVDVQVLGIPKTIDNDISVTDHAPGYGSAARYIAATVSEVSQDVKALPIHVCVVETMGRNTGWITAASALARTSHGDGPDLIYLPERPFDEEEYLQTVKELYDKKGGVVVVVSEGLKNKEGNPIVEPIFQVGRAVYYGDVSAHLSNLVIRRLGIKARNEKPGICGRASIAFQSSVDREEAIVAGREAVKAAMAGQTGVMVGFRRLPGDGYKTETMLIPIEKVMLEEKTMPNSFINSAGNDVTQEFVDWCRPLIGEPLREFACLR